MSPDVTSGGNARRAPAMGTPRVSVVIPTYNHAHFLDAALASVRAQTMGDWEAIVVNNFSTDDTEALVAALQDPRVRLINFANQGVIAAARNQGIAQARADVVAFIDSDDTWEPEKLARGLARLDQGFDLVCHGERWTFEEGGGSEVFYGPQERASFAHLLFEGNCISTSAVMVRREWLARAGGFDEAAQFVTAEDYHLWLKLARAGARIGFVRELLGTYRLHAGNQSRAALRNMQATRAVFESLYSQMPPPGPGMRLRAWRRRAILDYSGARGLQASGQHRQALAWFFKAIARWPFAPKFYAALLLNCAGVRRI